MKEKILIANGDKNISSLIKKEISKDNNYDVIVETEPELAIEKASEICPDIILLDIDFLKLSVCDVLKILRSDIKTSKIIVILMSGNYTTTYDIVNALKSGADDYITEPFQVEVLAAKVKAYLRRRKWQEQSMLSHKLTKNTLKSADNKIVVDANSREVVIVTGNSKKKKGYKLVLTKKEFDILEYFLKNRNVVISRNLLIQNLWPMSSGISEKTVDKHIEKLRNKLKGAGNKIEAVSGVGYRFNN